jgi:hypothetical protein
MCFHSLSSFCDYKSCSGTNFPRLYLDLELDVPPAAEITASLAKIRIKKNSFCWGGFLIFVMIINRSVISPFQID